MTIDRDIIFDLLPLYRAGLASDASRRAVDAWFAAHPEDGLKPRTAPEDDLAASLGRARQLQRRLRWLNGLAIASTVLCFSAQIHFEEGRVASAELLAWKLPWLFAPIALAALAFWTGYFVLKRRLR